MNIVGEQCQNVVFSSQILSEEANNPGFWEFIGEVIMTERLQS